ncbi:MAG TPA: hypothetical protein VHY84_14905 [Bryobacteraceae bacterium]|jgi:hypothetical protein|nr:hypothetical protein [Bryobacteraceae bacterium]
MAYDAKAVDFVYSFYARGWSKAKALPEIRKVYAGFAGSTWDEWETKNDWRQRRALADAKLREFEDTCRAINQTLLMDLEEARKRLFKLITEDAADNQTYYAFGAIAKRIAELAREHFAGRDADKVATRVLNDAIEFLLIEMRQIPGLALAMEENAAAIGQAAESVAEKFGQ